MPHYSGSHVVRAVGLGQKVLTQWIDRYLVIPSLKAPGRGARHGFTLVDVIRIAIAEKLSRMGLPRQNAAVVCFCSPATEIGADLLSKIETVINSYREEVKTAGHKRESLLGRQFAQQVYLVIVPKDDVPGKVAKGFHITGRRGFADLYGRLESDDVAVIINLTKLIKGIMVVLETWQFFPGSKFLYVPMVCQ